MTNIIYQLDKNHSIEEKTTLVNGITFVQEYSILTENTDVFYYQKFFTEQIIETTNALSKYFRTIDLKILSTSKYDTINGDETQMITRSSERKIRINREPNARAEKIKRALLYLTNPQEYFNENDEMAGYALSHANDIYTFSVSYLFPLENFPQALSANARIDPELSFSRFINYPLNIDIYCFFHCLYHEINEIKIPQKCLNNDIEYMKKFNEFLTPFKQYYNDEGCFDLSKISVVEEDLGINKMQFTANKVLFIANKL